MSQEQAKAFIDSATQALQGGQFAQALEFAQQAITMNPESSEAFVLKGIAHSQLQQPNEATEALRHAIMLSPYNVKAYYNLAVHYFGMGEMGPAEDMAREAIRSDPKHVGAKDLLARIAAATAPKQPEAPKEQGVGHDPLAAQPPASGQPEGLQPPVQQPMPPPSSGPTPPTLQPPGGQPQPPYQQPQAPHQPPQGPYSPPPGQPYYRPGYENQQVHSVAFIENMGKNWTTVGYGIGFVASAFWVFGLVQYINYWNQSGGDIQRWAEVLQSESQKGGPGQMLLSLLSLFTLLLSLIWFIMDLTDRRGNWLWLLPYVVCCCCGMGGYGPLQLIYIWKGRE